MTVTANFIKQIPLAVSAMSGDRKRGLIPGLTDGFLYHRPLLNVNGGFYMDDTGGWVNGCCDFLP